MDLITTFNKLRVRKELATDVMALLDDVITALEDSGYSKSMFFSELRRKMADSDSSIDRLKKKRTLIKSVFKKGKNNEEEEVIEESKKKEKSKDIKFELRTVGELEDGGYEQHYKYNTVTDSNLENKAEELLKAACPKCGSTNLFKSVLRECYECEDCECVVRIEDCKSKK